MADKILIRRGLKKDLPVLEEGELGFCTDTKELFIGSDAGNIPISGGGGATTPSAPNNVTGLVTENVTDKSLNLKWNATYGATSYDIQRNGVFLINVTSMNYQVTGLTGNTTYNFTVKAKNSTGSASGVSVSVKTALVGSDVNVLAMDTFNRANSSTLGNAETGQPWVLYGTTGTPAYAIDGNRATMTADGGHSSRNFAAIDVGVSNFIVKTTFTTIAQGAIVLRAKKQSDPVEFIRLRVNAQGEYELAHYKGATANNSSPAVTTPYGVAPNAFAKAGDIVEVRIMNTSVEVLINGVSEIFATIDVLTTETLVGINGGFGTHYFDDFLVTSITTEPKYDEEANQVIKTWVGGIE